MRKEMHLTRLLDLKDTQYVFWWVTLNVNKKTPQGTFKAKCVKFVLRVAAETRSWDIKLKNLY